MTYMTYEKTLSSDSRLKKLTCFSRHIDNGVESFKVEDGHSYTQRPKRMPLIVPKSNFMPTYLVRTSDMKVVQGSQVHEGYCTLSYSWNQSGEIVINETSKKSHRRIDEGKHKIILPAKIVRKKPRGRKRIPRKIKYVKFEGLIQKICKDFNVKYIWYDQMCINQNDEEEKHREIRQMHKIYSSAYCTIALVPELDVCIHPPTYNYPMVCVLNTERLISSQWMQRIWTLEETLMSSKMLFVGPKAHCWWYRLPEIRFPIFYHGSHRDAASVLHWAHARTTTKEHDHVFALVNISPEVMKEITIDYNQNSQKLMIQFYCALAKNDLSILCFRGHNQYKRICRPSSRDNSVHNSTKEREYTVPIQKFDLPSWTGVGGEHLLYDNYRTCFKNYAVNGRVMQVTCSGMTNSQHLTEVSDISSITQADIPPLKCDAILVIRVPLPESAGDVFINISGLVEVKEGIDEKTCKYIGKMLQTLSHFMRIKKSNLQWKTMDSLSEVTTIVFHNLTESLPSFAQYVLLVGIQFASTKNEEDWLFPVIKKNGIYYKTIGVCEINGPVDSFNKIKEETFKIH